MPNRAAAAACLLAGLPVAAHCEEVAPNRENARETKTIVVTARRRAEEVQQVPAAISVVAGDTLTRT